jgi:hypothetical protein
MILVCWGDMESSRPLWGHISRKLPYLLEVAGLWVDLFLYRYPSSRVSAQVAEVAQHNRTNAQK